MSNPGVPWRFPAWIKAAPPLLTEALTQVGAGPPLHPGESLRPTARDSLTGSASPLLTRARGKSDGEGGARQLQPFRFNNPRCFPESIFTSFSAQK